MFLNVTMWNYNKVEQRSQDYINGVFLQFFAPAFELIRRERYIFVIFGLFVCFLAIRMLHFEQLVLYIVYLFPTFMIPQRYIKLYKQTSFDIYIRNVHSSQTNRINLNTLCSLDFYQQKLSVKCIPECCSAHLNRLHSFYSTIRLQQ